MTNYKVLIIDYEPRSIDRLTQYLENAGFGVEVAADGIAGIEAFARMKPDLCLIEVMLPRRSGLEVCRALKGTTHGGQIQIVVMTSRFRSHAYRSQAVHQFGADSYLEKPVSDEALRPIVEGIIAEARSVVESAEAEIVDRLNDAISCPSAPQGKAPHDGKAKPPDGEPAT